MKPIYWLVFLFLVAFASAGSGFWFYNYHQLTKLTERPNFSLPDLKGQLHSISEWDGKIVVINFWATWCPPCIEEMPVFIKLQERYGPQGLQIVGIGIDRQDAIQHFVRRLGINYPVLIGEQDAILLAEKFGNMQGGLPFTVVIDQKGKVTRRYLGEIVENSLEAEIVSLLAQKIKPVNSRDLKSTVVNQRNMDSVRIDALPTLL